MTHKYKEKKSILNCNILNKLTLKFRVFSKKTPNS